MADSKRVRISKREGALMARLSAKEQEVYEVQASARDLYRARRPVTDFARQVYTDPAINVEFQLLTAQLAEMENSLRLKEAELKELRTTADKQDKSDKEKGAGPAAKGPDGAANKGTAGNSASGGNGESTAARASSLVARCQRLEQENEELAASADVAKVAQLTSEKAVAEAYAGELKTALEEAYEYIEQLEEEREVASNKVYGLEEELRNVASQRRHYENQQQQQQQQHHHHQQQEQEQQQQQQQQQQGDPSWREEGRDEHQEQHQHQHQQNHQHRHHGGEGEGVEQRDSGSRPGSNSSSGYHRGHDALPPPPAPEAEAHTAEAAEGGDDMDDLYGDMSMNMDSVGGAYSADDSLAVKDDPMQEEEEEEGDGGRRGDGSPAGARTRNTRRATRSRK